MNQHALHLRPVAGEPELIDPAITGAFAEPMAAIAHEVQTPPWCGYIGWSDETPLGFGGFKAVPDEDGAVEIGYLTFPANEGRGVATAIAAAMIEIAFGGRAKQVIAHTLCEPNASTRVLEKNGFARDGYGYDPDEGQVWRWKLTR